MKKYFISAAIILLSFNVFAQQAELTGNLNFDSQIAFQETKEQVGKEKIQIMDYKSPLVSAGLSAILPGAGQYYNDDIWKTAIFIAVEAAAIYTAVTYESKGDDQTDKFEAFAHENWDPVRYATWTYEKYVTNGDKSADLYPRDQFFAQVNNNNWALLNKLENDIGGYYSHRLAPFNDQQYFEMIGKYSQFNPGWNDFQEDIPYSFTYGQPVTNNFKYYSGERAEANDFYTVSKTAVIIVVTNHIISAVEAAWSANRYNRSLEMNVSLEKENVGYVTEFIPQLNMKYRISL